MSWLDWIFDSSSFATRDHCGAWTDLFKYVYVFSNAAIAFSYFVIPIALMFMYRLRRGDVIARWMLVMFILFIGGCGLTHVGDVLAFYWPAYRFFTILALITAIASVPTAILLPIEVARAIDVPTPEQYREINRKLEIQAQAEGRLIDSQKEIIRALRHQAKNWEQIRTMGVWTEGQQKILGRLYEVVSKAEDQIKAIESDLGLVNGEPGK
jgi:hypothetical protein